jgi:hypothetical protein
MMKSVIPGSDEIQQNKKLNLSMKIKNPAGWLCQPAVQNQLLNFPCEPTSSAGWSGDFGEDCLSTQCEFRSRLTSRATQGTPQRRQTGGAFFGLLFLARQEK